MRSENLRRSLDKSVLDPDLEISGGEGGGVEPSGLSLVYKYEGGPPPPPPPPTRRAAVWSTNTRGARPPRPLPWIRYCRLSSVSSRSLGCLDAPGSTAQLEAEATGKLKQRRRRRQREGQKSNRFRLAKQQLCTCITLFDTFLCRRCTTTT